MGVNKLLARISILCGLVIATCLAIILAVHFTGSSRPLSIVADKEKQLQATASPKVVFVGGSNVAFGIDSPLVEQRLNVPVVNMGLHGGLGLRFMLNQVKPFLRDGDLVVVSPEYESFLGLVNGDETMLDLLYLYPEAIHDIELSQLVALIPKLPGSIQVQFQGLVTDLLLKSNDTTYSRSGFNQNGDEVSHLTQRSTVDLTGKQIFGSKMKQFDADSIHVLSDFTAYAKVRNAHVVFTFPPIPLTEYAKGRTQIETVCRHLLEIRDLVLLDQPSDQAYPLDLFYDTLYHLNAQGRTVRTEKIIREVEMLEETGKSASGCEISDPAITPN